MRTVARAEPSVVLAGVADGDAAQVGADAKDDEPLGLEGPVLVGLLITKGVHGDGGFGGDLVGGAVTDEDGLAAPLDGDGLADIDIGQVELGGGHGQDVGGRGHGGDELHDEDPGRGGVGEANARQHEVGEGTTLGLGHSVNSVGGVSLIDAAELVELGRGGKTPLRQHRLLHRLEGGCSGSKGREGQRKVSFYTEKGQAKNRQQPANCKISRYAALDNKDAANHRIAASTTTQQAIRRALLLPLPPPPSQPPSRRTPP